MRKSGGRFVLKADALLAMTVVLTAFFSSLAQQKADVLIAPAERKIVDPTSQGLSLVFHLTLTNTTQAPLDLVKYDYTIMVEQTEYLRLETSLDEPIRIGPNSEIPIAFPFKITYEYLLKTVPGVGDKDRATCYVTGGMTFRDERGREKRVSIAFSGDFPIYRGLDLRILPIESRSMTLGGADLVIKLAVKNLNGFPFVIERFSGRFELLGMTVIDGLVGRDATVEARGEKVFSIPLILDFFEIGKDIYNGLEQPPVPVRFTGEVTISSPWGEFRIPVEKSAKADVVRGQTS
jgi:LEA14-like dessication related protein